MKKVYKVSKLFLSGSLKGMTITEETSVAFEVGEVIKSFNNTKYKIVEVVVI